MSDEKGGAAAELDRGDVVAEEVKEEAKDEKKVEAAEEDTAGASPQNGDEDPQKGADDEDKEAKDKRIRIPKWRFDEAVSKARAREEALQAEIETLKADRARETQDEDPIVKVEKRLEELEDAYETHVTSGEKDKAAAVRAQKRALERELLERRDADREYRAVMKAKNLVLYDTTFERLAREFPIIDENSEEYSASVAKGIASWRDGLVRDGVTPATALEQAVREVLGIRSSRIEKGGKPADDRSEKAREAALKATGKTPPRLDKVGLDSDKAGAGSPRGIMQLSQDEFAKLSEDDKAAMRGDVL